MAAFKDKKNGTWYVQFRYTDWKGERQQKLKRGFETKREAVDWEREFLLQKKSDPNMTFESYAKMYEADVKPRLKLNTWLSKESVIQKKILPYFAKRRLCDISAKDVIEWQNEMRSITDKKGKKYSSTYLKTVHNQVIIYKGWFLPPNIYYDCGSFVVNRKAVVGKEKKPFNRYKSNTKGATAYDDCYINEAYAFQKNGSVGFIFSVVDKSICGFFYSIEVRH